MTRNADKFETQPCTRCGGSGWFSYCRAWGHTCFRCGVRKGEKGLGKFLTARGAAAHAFYLSLLPTKLATELAPGDVFLDTGRAWLTVVSVTDNAIDRQCGSGNPDGTFTYAGRNIRTKHVTLCARPDTEVFTLRPTPEQREAALARAIEYQSTLTKAGKPRKVRGAAA